MDTNPHLPSLVFITQEPIDEAGQRLANDLYREFCQAANRMRMRIHEKQVVLRKVPPHRSAFFGKDYLVAVCHSRAGVDMVLHFHRPSVIITDVPLTEEVLIKSKRAVVMRTPQEIQEGTCTFFRLITELCDQEHERETSNVEVKKSNDAEQLSDAVTT